MTIEHLWVETISNQKFHLYFLNLGNFSHGNITMTVEIVLKLKGHVTV